MSFPQIVCTLGTTTDDPEVMRAMAEAGMGLARINSAYASLEELRTRTAASPVPVMLDLKGPQLRVDCTTEKTDPGGRTVTVPCRYPIAAGEVISVGFGPQSGSPVRFNHDFSADLAEGDLVTFDNGTIRTQVIDGASRGLDRPAHGVLLEILEAGGGRMTPQMGANVPGKRLSVPHLSDRDRQVLAMGIELGVPWFALSFVREADDVRALDDALGPATGGIIVKIEELSGIGQLEPIVGAVRRSGRQCAVMIARGDLFVELPPVQLPRIQADLLRRCRELEVPSIVATGLLLSMQNGPMPARSEVCDVAAALQAGADSLMLSDETSNGKNPVAAVKMLADLIGEYREEPPNDEE